MTGVVYDPYSTEVHQDPYPIFSRLRADAPVYHNQERGFWAVSRYEDVAAVSLDWERFTARFGVDIDNYGDVLCGGFFLAQDPPQHTKLRAVCRAAFGPARLRDHAEAAIRSEVQALVGLLARSETSDLAADLAWQLCAMSDRLASLASCLRSLAGAVCAGCRWRLGRGSAAGHSARGLAIGSLTTRLCRGHRTAWHS
jgi:cytochrome P450